MPEKEALLLLTGKRHDKASPAVGQPHHKHLNRLLDPADDGDRLPPIHLRILARLKLQWQKERWGCMVFVPLGHMQTHARFTALVALSLEKLIDLMAGILLLVGQMRIFGQQRVCTLTICSKYRGRLRLGQPVGLRWPIIDRLVHRFPRMAVLTGNLPLTLAFQVVM